MARHGVLPGDRRQGARLKMSRAPIEKRLYLVGGGQLDVRGALIGVVGDLGEGDAFVEGGRRSDASRDLKNSSS